MINPNRWLVVFGGIICQFCVGMLYSWSIFRQPLQDMFHWTAGQVSLTFSLSTFMLPVAMVAGGRLMQRFTPAKVAAAGGITLAFGLFMASLAGSLPLLYLGYGLLGGFGVGMVYGVPIAVCVKWFPERKGMISGLAVAGFGLGSVVYAPVASRLILLMGPLHTFRVQAAVTLIGILIGAPLLKSAPELNTLHDGPSGEQRRFPADRDAGQAVPADRGGGGFTPGQMLRTKQYWFLLLMYVFANTAGLMIVGHAAPIGRQIAGLTAGQAASVVSVLAILNMLGRFFGGAASDRFGNFPVLTGLFLTSALTMLAMRFLHSYALYALGTGLIAFCFGGAVGDFPSIIFDYFGEKYYGVNYGLVFMAYGIGGILGPQLAAVTLRLNDGIYTPAFIIAGLMCTAGAIMSRFSRKPGQPAGQP